MKTGTRLSSAGILFVLLPLICEAFPSLEREYRIEAYQKEGDTDALILKLSPFPSNRRQARQEDEDEEDVTTAPLPTSTPFIPAVIPALTKIFQGLITGNLNTIFHGGTSFAPQNVSYAIDSVYNQVVGIAPPISTPPTTLRTAGVFEPEPTPAPSPPPPSPTAAAPSQPSGAAAGQPLASASIPAIQPLSQGSVVVPSTSRPSTTTEDDEDDSRELFAGFDRRVAGVNL